MEETSYSLRPGSLINNTVVATPHTCIPEHAKRVGIHTHPGSMKKHAIDLGVFFSLSQEPLSQYCSQVDGCLVFDSTATFDFVNALSLPWRSNSRQREQSEWLSLPRAKKVLCLPHLSPSLCLPSLTKNTHSTKVTSCTS